MIPIHRQIEFAASPARIYELLTDSAKFSAATGQPAEIGSAEGDAFSVFTGRIHGRTVELLPGKRVVLAWRMPEWEAGVFSLVRFELADKNGGTMLTLDQSGHPDGASPLFPTWQEHLEAGWQMFYFEPLAKAA